MITQISPSISQSLTLFTSLETPLLHTTINSVQLATQDQCRDLGIMLALDVISPGLNSIIQFHAHAVYQMIHQISLGSSLSKAPLPDPCPSSVNVLFPHLETTAYQRYILVLCCLNESSIKALSTHSTLPVRLQNEISLSTSPKADVYTYKLYGILFLIRNLYKIQSPVFL